MDLLPHEKQVEEYEKTILQIKEQNKNNPLWTKEELLQLEEKLDKFKKKVYSNLSPSQRIAICRHPQRPHTLDYFEGICDSFEELHGDRLFADDQAMIGGLGIIGGKKFVLIGQEKGSQTEERVKRNFGMPHPEGYRKALRLMKLAEKFTLPVISFIDTPGAFPGLTAEERGQGWAIAYNLREMFRIKTPLIAMIIGEGCSGGAIGIGVGDCIAMLQHSYYSVISPEGCASILWKNAGKKALAAQALKLNSEHLLKAKIVDHVIEEPLGGAHHDRLKTLNNVKKFVVEQAELLQKISKEDLIEKRFEKFRNLGQFQEDLTISSNND
jgi:acetyl-CoA carboxylase carboxyl transferase subunit alpha